MSNVVSLADVRGAVGADDAIDRAIDARDLSMVVEVERRFAEALADVASLGGVTVNYLDALMRAAWALPESGGGGHDE